MACSDSDCVCSKCNMHPAVCMARELSRKSRSKRVQYLAVEFLSLLDSLNALADSMVDMRAANEDLIDQFEVLQRQLIKLNPKADLTFKLWN